MSAAKANRFGRKPGRGRRPWLLAPKVLAVATAFDACFACGVITLADPQAVAAPRLLWTRLVEPGALIATALGVALFAQHRQAFARMWWWRAKMLVVIGFVWTPLALGHFWITPGVDQATRLGVIGAALMGLGGAVILGRFKPRLGQPTLSRRQLAERREPETP